MDFAARSSSLHSLPPFQPACLMTENDPSILGPIAEQHRLNPIAWQQLIRQSQRRSGQAGEVLFDEGDFNPNLYLLMQGQVDLSMKVTGRGFVKILSLGSGDIIAWSAMLGAGRMTCRATCLTECELIFWKQEQLEAMCRDQPEFGVAWMRFVATALSSRLLATRLQLLDLFASDSRSRHA